MKVTKADIIKYLTLIQAEFPSKELDGDTQRLRVEMWYKVLSEYTKEEVDTAVYEVITNCEFAPRIKNIVDICKRNRNPYTVSPMDLWNEVLSVLPQVEEAVKEIKLGNYRAWDERIQDYGKLTHYEKGWHELDAIFQKLRPEIKRYFGNQAGRLSALTEMTDEAREFEKTRFLKAVQSFITETETATRNGTGEYFEQLAGGQKLINERANNDSDERD